MAITAIDEFIAEEKIDKSDDGWKTRLPKPPRLRFGDEARGKAELLQHPRGLVGKAAESRGLCGGTSPTLDVSAGSLRQRQPDKRQAQFGAGRAFTQQTDQALLCREVSGKALGHLTDLFERLLA